MRYLTSLLFNNSINSLKSWDSIEFPPVVFGSDFFQSGQPGEGRLALPVDEIRTLLVDSFYANGFYDYFGHDKILPIFRLFSSYTSSWPKTPDTAWAPLIPSGWLWVNAAVRFACASTPFSGSGADHAYQYFVSKPGNDPEKNTVEFFPISRWSLFAERLRYDPRTALNPVSAFSGKDHLKMTLGI
ncbi:MAG: hypothetical protein K9K88_02080 [Desulfobacterales bacterium]|nr:hypothetical protein [Desulfobacterales bacterium]